MKNSSYSPEIDGIRAIAVMSVVFVHVEFSFFPGGFTGVDVFFVISGYLITKLIMREVDNGVFSLKSFYFRRAKRLLPALIFVLAVTFIVAFYFLTPTHFQRYSAALFSSLFSFSNFYFWSEAGYFDASADLKPLLHTWSLSVEEQFYFFWPAMILLLSKLKKRKIIIVISFLGILSIIASKYFSNNEPSAAFFLMPFRIYEFMIGALIVFFPKKFFTHNRNNEVAIVVGSLLVLISILFINKATPFPDIYALIPCIGAALLILGRDAHYSGWILRNKLSVFLGQISYSLYLVHWPIIVFYKHIRFRHDISERVAIGLIVISICIATLLNIFVENKFRYDQKKEKKKIKVSFIFYVILSVCMILGATHSYLNNGWSWRFNEKVVTAIGDLNQKQDDRSIFVKGINPIGSQPFPANGTKNILILGDSHSVDLFNAFYLNLVDRKDIALRRLALDDACIHLFVEGAVKVNQSQKDHLKCKEQYNPENIIKRVVDADVIFYSTRWQIDSPTYLNGFATFINDVSNAELIITGRTAEFKNVPQLIFNLKNFENMERTLARTRNHSLDEINRFLVKVSQELNLKFVDKVQYQCSGDLQLCDIVDKDGYILYTDYGHWTLEGAKLFGSRLIQNEVIREVLSTSK